MSDHLKALFKEVLSDGYNEFLDRKYFKIFLGFSPDRRSLG
jgi:hypothetical protein